MECHTLNRRFPHLRPFHQAFPLKPPGIVATLNISRYKIDCKGTCNLRAVPAWLHPVVDFREGLVRTIEVLRAAIIQ
jgi:ubiquitin-protein ligase